MEIEGTSTIKQFKQCANEVLNPIDSLWTEVLDSSTQSPFYFKEVRAMTNAYMIAFTEASIDCIELALSFDSFFIRQYYKIYKERLEKADNTKWKLLATFRYNKAFRAKEKFYASFCSYKKNRAELNRLSKKLDKLNREDSKDGKDRT